jgi:hypothetical protein
MGLFTNRIIEATKRFIPKTFFGMEIDSYELGWLPFKPEAIIIFTEGYRDAELGWKYC